MVRFLIATLTIVFTFIWTIQTFAQDEDLNSILLRIEEYSQEGKRLKSDSLLSVARTMITDDTPLKDIFRYKYYLGHSLLAKWKLPEAEPAFEEAIRIAYELNDSASIVAALSGMATLSNYKGDVHKAIQLQETAKDIFQNGDSSAYYGLIVNLGIGYNTIHQYDKSLDHYLSAKKFFEKTGERQNLALIENNLGELYRERFEDYEMAQKHYEQAIEINESLENKSGLSMNYHNLALNYIRLEKPDSALSYIMDAIQIKDLLGEDGKMASDYCVLGDVYTALGDYKKAYNQYSKTLSISEQFSIMPGFYYANMGLADLFMAQKRYDKAEQYAENAVDAASEMNSPGMRADALQWLYELHKAEGKFDEAIAYLEKHELLNDSLESVRDESFLTSTKSRYEADLAKSENQKLKLQQRANQVAKKNDQLIKAGLIIISLVLIILAIVIYSAYRIKAKSLQELSVLNANLKESNNQIIKQKEELRKLNKLKTNIVSVLGHDLRGPLINVSGIVGLLRDQSITKKEFEDIVRLLDEKTNSGLKSLDMVLEWSRLEAGDSSPKIEHINVKEVVDEIISLNKDSISEKSLSIKADFNQQATLPADPNQFLSIAINLISNAIKFSDKEGSIKIGVNEELNRVRFSVQDSGAGFSDDVLNNLGNGERLISSQGSLGEKGTGIGLRIVSDFIDAHGGELVIKNHPDGGGLVSVSFPKNNELAQAG